MAYLDGARVKSFDAKALKLKRYFEKDFPGLIDKAIVLQTKNTFPHSSGIASSASGMAALSLCLLNFFKTETDADFFHLASYYARLGSGSAGRSLFPHLAAWGLSELKGTTDEKAIAFNDYHEIFKDYQDSILIVSKDEKSVSSTAGHKLMENHPYADARVQNANKNFHELLSVLKNGDLEQFNKIVESEALELHSLMMTSTPSFILLAPETLAIVMAVRQFRKESKIPLCFTIDAGPNVHLLYPKKYLSAVHEFINAQKKNYLSVIHDEVGMGPQKI